MHDLDDDERATRLGEIADELLEIRKERAESDEPATTYSMEFDVLFESNERMSVEAAGQPLAVEKRQRSTWRFLSPGLEAPEWRVCKIF